MNDKFGRKLEDLRISVTDRCNFRCRYCMPEELYGEAFEFLKKDQILSFEEIIRLCEIFISLGVKKIRITGGEPLVRKDVSDLINSISKINNKIEIAMTTNGYLLEKYASKRIQRKRTWLVMGTRKLHDASLIRGWKSAQSHPKSRALRPTFPSLQAQADQP